MVLFGQIFIYRPDGKTLATIGCYWACPFVTKVFDFSNPMVLPLTEIKEIELLGNEIIVGWLDRVFPKLNWLFMK